MYITDLKGADIPLFSSDRQRRTLFLNLYLILIYRIRYFLLIQ